MKLFPWLKMRRKTDRALPCEPPIWLGPGSFPQTARERKLRKLVLEAAAHNARRLGMDRRQFLASSMGMATSLWMMNQVTACSRSEGDNHGSHLREPDAGAGGEPSYDGGTGAGGRSAGGSAGSPDGGCSVPYEAMYDETCANAVIGGDEFIFDVHTNWISNEDLANNYAYLTAFGPLFAIATEEAYIETIFCNSDTTMTCLTGYPGVLCTPTRRIGCGLPLSNESIANSRDRINALSGNTRRVLNHVQVLAQDPSGLELQLRTMEEYACTRGVAAWKLYPGFKPGFRLDGALVDAVVEKGMELGVNIFCAPKGMPSGNFSDTNLNYPDDVGPAGKRHPYARFVVYTAAICSGTDPCSSIEGPYDPDEARPTGTNALVRSLIDSDCLPGENVYAEVGRAFNRLKSDPNQSAHFFGKLLKHLGENNVLWGTDAILGGNPQDQIEVFRALEIPVEMQDQFGYPALTPAIKAKVFGLNAARLYGVDPAAVRCQTTSCPVTAMKQRLDGDLGPRRWTLESALGSRGRRA